MGCNAGNVLGGLANEILTGRARIILETGAGCTRPWVQVKAKQFVQLAKEFACTAISGHFLIQLLLKLNDGSRKQPNGQY